MRAAAERLTEPTTKLTKGEKGRPPSDLHEARRSYVRFRNLLRPDPEEAARYEAHKLQLAERFPHDRKRRTAGKNELIAQLLGE